jgi:hypothetical protein
VSDASNARFEILRFEPGNPEFPTLPDGLTSLHILPIGQVPGLTFKQPIDNVLRVKGAAGATRGFKGFYLEGIWRVPSPVEFGNITAPKQRTVEMTNTFETTKTLTAVDVSPISGMVLVSPALPIDIEPFDSITLTFEAGVTGTPTFDTDILVTVSGVVLPIRMTGRRVVIFNSQPQRPMVERVTWLTDNMVSVNGKEQAFSLRHAPRSTVTVEQRITNETQRAALLNQMQAVGFLRCGVQAWWQSREISAAVQPTDLVIQADTENMEIANGDLLSLVSPDYADVVEVEVASFTTTSVTATQQVGTAFPLRSTIMPLRFGFSKPAVDQATFATAIQDVRVTIDLIEYNAIPAVDLSYFELHPVDGKPIITHPLYFEGESRRDRIVNDIYRLDARTGDIATEQREPLGRPGQPVLVRCSSLADQHAWRRFLHYVRGSWGDFYIPTGTQDLPLNQDLELGTNQFKTPNLGSVQLLQNNAPRQDVAITVGSVTYFRRITLVTELATEETYTMSATLPGSGFVSPADVRISWLMPVRIVGDSAVFRHLRRGEAELRFGVRGVIK